MFFGAEEFLVAPLLQRHEDERKSLLGVRGLGDEGTFCGVGVEGCEVGGEEVGGEHGGAEGVFFGGRVEVGGFDVELGVGGYAGSDGAFGLG